jgi:hypothetical protein
LLKIQKPTIEFWQLACLTGGRSSISNNIYGILQAGQGNHFGEGEPRSGREEQLQSRLGRACQAHQPAAKPSQEAAGDHGQAQPATSQAAGRTSSTATCACRQDQHHRW